MEINKNNDINIDLLSDSICLVCLDLLGLHKLCVNCRFLYCGDCANKLNFNCCICRKIKKYNEFENNFELNIEYNPVYLIYTNICSLLFFIISLIGVCVFIFILIKRIFFILFSK